MTKLIFLLCKVALSVGFIYQTVHGAEEIRENFILDDRGSPQTTYEIPKSANICISFQGCEFPSHVILEQQGLQCCYPLERIHPLGQWFYACAERSYPDFANTPCAHDNGMAMSRVPYMVPCDTSQPFRLFVQYINNQSNTYYDACPVMLLGHSTPDIDVFNRERNEYIQAVRIAQWKKLPENREVNPNGYLTLTALERYGPHPLEDLPPLSAHVPYAPIWCPKNHIFPRFSQQQKRIADNIKKLGQITDVQTLQSHIDGQFSLLEQSKLPKELIAQKRKKLEEGLPRQGQVRGQVLTAHACPSGERA